MFSASDFDKAITSAREQLQSVQRALQKIRCPAIESLTVKLLDLSQEYIEAVLANVPTGYGKKDIGIDYIYVIQVSDERFDFVGKLSERLEEARKDAKDYPRLNREHLLTNTLYVGRSRTLRARLRQHFGNDHKGIYSLHFQRWATSIDADISVIFMKFSEAGNLLVQAVEDGLWASLKPAFGRKGER